MHRQSVALRSDDVAVIATAEHLLIVGPTTQIAECRDVCAALQLLENLTAPTESRSIPRAQAPLFAHLVAAGAVHVADTADAVGTVARAASGRRIPMASKPICQRIVVAATGAVQTTLLPHFLPSVFLPFASRVDVILTAGAQRFLTRHELEAMGARVWTDTFATDIARVPHMELAGADLVTVYPASAAALQRLASGACSDLMSLVVAATEAPVLLVPSMNGRMWRHPPIARNVRELIDDGAYVAVPGLAREVSADEAAPLQYGGAGIGEHNMLPAMASVLDHCRLLT